MFWYNTATPSLILSVYSLNTFSVDDFIGSGFWFLMGAQWLFNYVSSEKMQAESRYFKGNVSFLCGRVFLPQSSPQSAFRGILPTFFPVVFYFRHNYHIMCTCFMFCKEKERKNTSYTLKEAKNWKICPPEIQNRQFRFMAITIGTKTGIIKTKDECDLIILNFPSFIERA